MEKLVKNFGERLYIVGGFIRDTFLNLEPKDMDLAIEKCSIEEFISVFPDAQRVGTKPNSPPVFLIQGNEVALARTETKTGDAYQDYQFECGVSIEEDLARRDFTIGSIARHYVTGEIVDPFNGINDIRLGIIRCVNPVAFSDDPLRIYRSVRFAARFGFHICDETFFLMYENRDNLQHVLPERVHLELEKLYKESTKPSIFFYELAKLNALKTHFKPLYLMTKVPAGPVMYHGHKTAFDHTMDAFDKAKANGYSFDVACAILFHDVGKGVTRKEILPAHHGHEIWSYIINKQYVKQHRFTAKQEEMIIMFAKQHMKFHYLEQMGATKLIRFYRIIKKYADEMTQAANCDSPLNAQQYIILAACKKAIKDTIINIPKGCKDISGFVEEKYAKTLRGLLK